MAISLRVALSQIKSTYCRLSSCI